MNNRRTMTPYSSTMRSLANRLGVVCECTYIPEDRYLLGYERNWLEPKCSERNVPATYDDTAIPNDNDNYLLLSLSLISSCKKYQPTNQLTASIRFTITINGIWKHDLNMFMEIDQTRKSTKNKNNGEVWLFKTTFQRIIMSLFFHFHVRLNKIWVIN